MTFDRHRASVRARRARQGFSLALALVLAGFGFASCNSENTTSGDTLSQWIDEFAALLCDLDAKCCAPNGFTPPPPAECLDKAKTALNAIAQDEIEDGARFDRQAADRCASIYRGLAPRCPLTIEVKDESCEKVFVKPPKPPSSTCDAGCAPSDAGVPKCKTQTTAYIDGGITKEDYCQIDVIVAPGDACDELGSKKAVARVCDSSVGSWCGAGICQSLKPIGAPCTSENGSSSVECVREAYCWNHVCTARIAAGGACSAQECVEGASCQAGKCVAYTIWKKYCAADFD